MIIRKVAGEGLLIVGQTDHSRLVSQYAARPGGALSRLRAYFSS